MACERVFIVGGGFSHYAGLPLTSEFTKALVSAQDPEKGLSGSLVRHLENFIEATFGHTLETFENWPTLEDLFTCIDLAANSGHHLGNSFSAAELRTVRRCLIARIIRMLQNRNGKAKEEKDKNWRRLNRLLTNIDYESSAFVSMNWDEVIEQYFLLNHSNNADVDYGCNAIHAEPSTDRLCIIPIDKSNGPNLTIVKIHGSVNWLYCDNCQQTFWFRPGHGDSISKRLLSDTEWGEIRPKKKSQVNQWACPFCPKVILSTRLATFSYQKALDFPMFQKSWFTAESLLREAKTWAFIGYSLPAADYEFKYLLKRIQLSRKTLPRIILVTGGNKNARETTYNNYQRFFGETFQDGINCFLKGINAESTRGLLDC